MSFLRAGVDRAGIVERNKSEELNGVARGIPESERTLIQSIRETTGKQHSDEDILAILEDCAMDADETAQRLLYLDTFHEVRRKPRKKELTLRAQVRGRSYRPNNFDAFGGRVGPRRGDYGNHGVVNNHSPLTFPRSESVGSQNSFKKGFDFDGKSFAVKIFVKDNASADEKKIAANTNSSSESAVKPSAEEIVSSLNESNHMESHALGNESACAKQEEGIKIAENSHSDLPEKDESTCSEDSTDDKKASCRSFKVVSSGQNGEEGDCDSSSEESMIVSHKDSFMKNGHVIFPNHLKVPEEIKNGLIFGNFDAKTGQTERTEEASSEGAMNAEIDARFSVDNQSKQEKKSQGEHDVFPQSEGEARESHTPLTPESHTPALPPQINLPPSPPPMIFRPPIHPSYLLYGHYFNPYFIPPMHLFLSHNGVPQHLTTPNPHISPPTNPPNMKLSPPSLKTGAAMANPPRIVPFYNGYGSSPVGFHPVSSPSSESMSDSQSKESCVTAATPLNEVSSEAPTLQYSNVYHLPVHGQHIAFPPAGMYPACQMDQVPWNASY